MKNENKLLNSIAKIINKEIDNMADSQNVEEIHDRLLTIHRILLILTDTHEERMIESGVADDLIELNIQAVEDACNPNDIEDAELITMPGGDA